MILYSLEKKFLVFGYQQSLHNLQANFMNFAIIYIPKFIYANIRQLHMKCLNSNAVHLSQF